MLRAWNIVLYEYANVCLRWNTWKQFVEQFEDRCWQPNTYSHVQVIFIIEALNKNKSSVSLLSIFTHVSHACFILCALKFTSFHVKDINNVQENALQVTLNKQSMNTQRT